jgi:hypothetical protein
LKCKFKTNAKALDTFAKLFKSQNERKRQKKTNHNNGCISKQVAHDAIALPLMAGSNPRHSVKLPKYRRPCWVFHKYLVPKMEGTRPINIALKF